MDDDDTPMVSVIIPCHRAVAVLPLQLEALSHQLGAPPFEVLLADNRENPGLHDLAAAWRETVPGLRVVDATAETGTAYARNCGAGQARADLLMFCDSDDVVAPDWVQQGALTLAEVEMFSGAAIPIPPNEFRGGYQALMTLLGEPCNLPGPLDGSGTEAYPILMGAGFGYRRELFERLGGFDLAFGALAEDNDLAFRTSKAGVQVVNASRVRLAYRLRSPGPGEFKRSFRTGWAHALLCARHGAWHRSPSYRSGWFLEPARAAARWVRDVIWRSEPGHLSGGLGRSLGLVLGRLWFALPGSIPPPRLGVGRSAQE